MPIIPNDTVSSILNLVNRTNPVSVFQPPLHRTSFALDASGVAAFFGGESAVRAMTTMYFIPQRRWLGWYNAPGAYEVAKQYSGLARSKHFDALFPTGARNPVDIVTVADRQVTMDSYSYTSLYSPTSNSSPTPKAPEPIGHIGARITKKIIDMLARYKEEYSKVHITENVVHMPFEEGLSLPTEHTWITFLKLNHTLPARRNKLYILPSNSNMFAFTTILISVGGCIACALVGDWFCFASIAIGIIANGVACSVIGSGRLYLEDNSKSPTQSGVDIPGDALVSNDGDIIFFVGNENTLRPLLHGNLTLGFKGMPVFMIIILAVMGCKSEILMEYLICIPVFLLLFQFLAQLLLIPQGTLFGQLMFIGTLVSSWMYHLYLSTLRLDLQTEALFEELCIQEKEDIYTHPFDTKTEGAVFSCLAFRSIHLLRLNPDMTKEMAEESQYLDDAHREKAEKEAEKVDTAFITLLFALLPGETDIWRAFRQSLVRKMSRSAIIAYVRDTNPSFKFDDQDAVVETNKGEIRLKYGENQELQRYQREAQQALDKWRSGFWGKEEMRRLAAPYK